jgi:hypothetical protein
MPVFESYFLGLLSEGFGKTVRRVLTPGFSADSIRPWCFSREHLPPKDVEEPEDWLIAGGAVGVSIMYLNNIERPEGVNFDYLTFRLAQPGTPRQCRVGPSFQSYSVDASRPRNNQETPRHTKTPVPTSTNIDNLGTTWRPGMS